MKITNKQSNKVQFNEVDHGDVFKDSNNHVYMRMFGVETDCTVYNAVDLRVGDTAYFSPTDMVEPLYDAELVI